MKNYINFVNDHSGSMGSLAIFAAADFNANIKAVKDAASAEMLDTVVSVVEVGGNPRLSVTVSNPHVLKPVNYWPTSGDTPLWTGTMILINMLKKLPDIDKPNVSVLVMLTTDGSATDDQHAFDTLKETMKPLLASGRWTFVARVPKQMGLSSRLRMLQLGIPEGNIQSWDTTRAGLKASTAQTTAAMNNFFTQRSAGAKASTSFYMDASKVDITALTDVSSKVTLYVVPPENQGIQIRDFILTKRMEYLKGAAFYQLTKTEARVQHNKQVLVRDRASGKIFAGKEARQMLGLPSDKNQRVHPGDHKNFDIFIQSFSINRKLVGGTGVVYWKEIGVPFTAQELAIFDPKPASPAPASAGPIVLPAVPVSTKPTPSPIPVTPRQPVVDTFDTREEARRMAALKKLPQSKILKVPGKRRGEARWQI